MSDLGKRISRVLFGGNSQPDQKDAGREKTNKKSYDYGKVL